MAFIVQFIDNCTPHKYGSLGLECIDPLLEGLLNSDGHGAPIAHSMSAAKGLHHSSYRQLNSFIGISTTQDLAGLSNKGPLGKLGCPWLLKVATTHTSARAQKLH